MKRLLLALLSSALAVAAARAEPSTRSMHNFNYGWRLALQDDPAAKDPGFDDTSWKSVSLPRAWNEDDAFRVSIDKHTAGVAWYRKTFRLPEGSAGKKIVLEFEGIRQAGEFWLNGKPVGLHENGAMAFGLDVTDAALPAPAENVLAVRIDNDWGYKERSTNSRYQWSDKNFNANYGGITKNVRLHIMDRVHQTLPLFSNLGTTGVYVYATDFNIAARTAKIHAQSEIKNESALPRKFKYKVSVIDADGRAVANFDGGEYELAPGQTAVAEARQKVNNLNFWSWGYGYLYDVVTSLESAGSTFDVVRTRTGFRKTEFANGVIKLNDRVIQMHGYAQRTSNEWPAVGMSVPPWLSDFSNKLMVESGGNLVRWMHITPWKQDVESSDRVGLIQAMPAGDSEKDVVGRWWEQRVELMRDAVIYNRNNPSILFYETGNKGVSEAHMQEMKAIRDRYDPHGGRAAGSREMLNRGTVAEYGGEMLYINKSARIPLWAMEYSRDEGLRKYWDEFTPPFHKDGDGPLHRGQSAAVYNRNQDSHAIENVVRWYDYWRERPGTGKRVSSGGVNIVFSDTNTHYRGAENYRRSGEVDAMRIPKDGFYAHQVMWDGWVDVERPRAHILGHWNYATGTTKAVQVVSSADRVELFLNGKPVGFGEQSSRFLFTFPNVSWIQGELKAIGYDSAGKQVCEAQLQTAGEPFALRLTATTSPTGFRADGADLALVEVEVVDRKGRRCPTALNLVDFSLEGPGEWRGGIAQGPDNYILSKQLPVECGVNRVLVRSSTQAGNIVLRASASGLEPASVTLATKPVEIRDGLSGSFAHEGLPSNLERGPTPSTPSFMETRRPLALVAAKSGSRQEDAVNSFDDDELTKWVGEPGKSWISFELARDSTPTEATLKLQGWRQRSYPIRIRVGDEVVFEGETPKSLGYVTLPLKAARGREITIELVGRAKDSDAYKLVEVADQKNTDTGANRLPEGVLAIIEAEFYER